MLVGHAACFRYFFSDYFYLSFSGAIMGIFVSLLRRGAKMVGFAARNQSKFCC